MASGGWVNKHVDRRICRRRSSTRTATFQYAPALIVNVALTNWRFMHKLGITAARWFDDAGVGFVANIRRQMAVGGLPCADGSRQADGADVLHRALHAGKTAAEQGVLDRAKLLATSYADYERASCRS